MHTPVVSSVVFDSLALGRDVTIFAHVCVILRLLRFHSHLILWYRAYAGCNALRRSLWAPLVMCKTLQKPIQLVAVSNDNTQKAKSSGSTANRTLRNPLPEAVSGGQTTAGARSLGQDVLKTGDREQVSYPEVGSLFKVR